MEFETMPTVPRAIVTLNILYLVLLFQHKKSQHFTVQTLYPRLLSILRVCILLEGEWGVQRFYDRYSTSPCKFLKFQSCCSLGKKDDTEEKQYFGI